MSRIDPTEKSRIIIAKELDVPPDDIDLNSILICLKREIENNTSEDQILIKPKRGREKKAIYSTYGAVIMNRIFNQEYPFENYLEDLEGEYEN